MPDADPVFQGPCFHDPSHTPFWVWPWGLEQGCYSKKNMKNNHQHGFLIYAVFLGGIPVNFSRL